MASRAPSQKVGVSFAGPPLLLASGTWKQITASLEAQLPLRNIHWKPAARSSIRTIQELYVNFMPLGTLRDENTSQVPVTVLDRPLLHMFFIACEDADLELYRTSVKKQIKDWHTSIVNRKNQEWLIVQVVKPEAKPVTGNFFAIKGSVYDKIRADFNTDKRDRCVQLSWSATSADNPATWAEAVNKIKEGLVSAFDLVLQQREEEVKRSEGQRLMPGWNFCTFFVLKETLATSFEGIGLYEDALAQYDELELLFYGVLKDKNLSWFGTLISPAPNDDSASLLSISKKPYKDLILANTISVFDFRIYLLARQCELLANLGRLNEVSHKTSAFLSAFGRRLREVQNTLPQYFIESWTYSSALSVVAQCDSWLAAFRVESPKVAALNAGKGELLELARIQLDNIGINAGHLPNKPPFCNAYQGPVSTTTGSPLKISNRDVLYAISDKDHFHELYVSTTKLAIDMYAKAGRRKFALKLHGSLAALDVHRQRLSTALTTFTSLPAHYSPHHWTSLEFFVLSRALDTHAALDQQHDRDWIHTLLAFLNAYVTTMGKELLMDQADSERYLVGLIEALQKAAVELDQQLEYTDHPALTLTAENEAVPSGNKDGNNLNIIVTNHLPCPLPVTEIRVNLVGRDSERLTFTAQTDSLAPGKTQLTTFSPIPLHGTFALDTSEAYISKLVLQRTHRKSSSSVKVLRSARDVTLVHIPHDLLALDLRVRQPDLIQLGRRSILVALSTGRNHLSRAMVRLSSQNVQHEHAKAVLASGSPPANIEAIDEGFTLLDVDPDCTVLIEVPHTGTPSARIMQVAIKVEYDVQDDPETTRTLLLSRSVLTSLPVAIHVKDHFRGNKLFSRFVVETTTHQHIRISDAQLELLDPAESARVSVCSRKARVVTVTPSQPASFLFCLQSNGGPVLESLRFSIKYRILREEVQALLDESVRSALGNDISDLPTRVTLLANLTKALESDTKWIQKYSITGELDVPSADNESVDPVLQLLRANRHSYPPKGKWKELAIPVDVPTMDIVAAAGLRVTSNPAAAEDASEESPFYAGQPLSALITVRTSFHWSDKPRDSDRQYTLRFDLEEMTQDWLVSGRKRGDFAAEDNGEFSFPVTLIALHHGELPLPKVIITPLPVAGEMTMGSLALPSLRTHQEHDAETLLVLPRGGRSTFVLGSS